MHDVKTEQIRLLAEQLGQQYTLNKRVRNSFKTRVKELKRVIEHQVKRIKELEGMLPNG